MMVQLDLARLLKEAEKACARVEMFRKEHETERVALEERHRTVRGESLQAMVVAVIAHNQACRQALLEALIGDDQYWCPFRRRLISLETGGPFRYCYEETNGGKVTDYFLYVLPSRSIDVQIASLVPSPLSAVEDVEGVLHYSEDRGYKPVPAEAKIVDIFADDNLLVHDEMLPTTPLADRYGIPSRLKIVNHRETFVPAEFSLEYTKHFPINFDHL